MARAAVAGFITTFGSQETCGSVTIINGRTEQTPSATASLVIVRGGRGEGMGGGGFRDAGDRPVVIAREHTAEARALAGDRGGIYGGKGNSWHT